MRQAGVIRYLVVAALLLLLAACGQFPGMRTNMPPVPAETPPGAAAPAPDQTPAPAPDLAQQVQNLEARVAQLESQSAQPQSRTAAPAATKPRGLPAPAAASSPKASAPAAASPGSDKNYTEGMRLYHAKKYGDARHQLYQYLKNQPKGPKAQEARYYLADSFYQEGKYPGSRGGVQ